jgi:hypothetical protein
MLSGDMEGFLRTAAVIASAIVLVSFGLFAIDETRDASNASVAGIAGKAHEAIDDADDVLVKPFASIANGSSSSWVRRGVPTLLALLIYGLGLSFLARFTRGRA